MAPVTIGLQLNVCSVEFSLYCNSHCVFCPYPENTWFVHSLPSGLCSAGNVTLSKLSGWEPVWVQETLSFGTKVRATSIILLLGVGSFVCYRLFRQLKRQLSKGGRKSSKTKTLPAKYKQLSSSRKKFLDYLLSDHNDLRNLSYSDFSDSSSCASYSDGETTSDTPSLSDVDSEPFVMGVSPSNPFEPVYFSKASGIHFQGSSHRNSQLDHLSASVGRHNSHPKCQLFESNEFPSSNHKENVFSCSGSFNGSGSYQEYQDFENSSNFDIASYDIPFISHDAASMHGNFSPGSLRECTLKTEQLLSGKLERSSKSNHILKRDYSVDSFTYNSDPELSGPASKRSLSRTLSVDSEVSELCVELQRQAEEVHEMGIVTVEKMENLEDEINDIKQSVLELDADLVGLKVYKKPPVNCWEITNISENSFSSEIKSGGVLDVVNHHRNKMWCKGLLSVDKLCDENATSSPEDCNSADLSSEWEDRCNGLLDWDVSADNPFEGDQNALDSGSDFGNSLETDSPDAENVSVNEAATESLEWDTNFETELDIPITEVDSASKSSKIVQQLRHPFLQSKSLKEDQNCKNTFKKKRRSRSIPSDVLSKQIRDALHKRLPIPISQVNSPVLESKANFSPVQNGTPSHLSDMNCSSDQLCSKSRISSDESWSQDAEFHSAEECNQSGYDHPEKQEFKNSNGNLSNAVIKSVNRDSAYCEGLDFPELRTTEIVGPEMTVQEHVAQLAPQHNHQLIKQAYTFVEEKLNLMHLRKVKGDFYGVIRATLFKMLSEGLPILEHYGGAVAVYQLLSSWIEGDHPWLLDWTFPDSLHQNKTTCLQGFWDCLQSLERMERGLSQVSNRGQHLAAMLNGNATLDVQLMEAVKLLMCVSACRLYSGHVSGTSGLPVFTMLLFARVISPTPKELLLNRLNRIGKDHSLQQVEIYLLAYSLSITLRILLLPQFGNQDFITYYPDCNLGSWKEVTLLAQDDVHFSVPER